jgi:hypothetical protein
VLFAFLAAAPPLLPVVPAAVGAAPWSFQRYTMIPLLSLHSPSIP